MGLAGALGQRLQAARREDWGLVHGHVSFNLVSHPRMEHAGEAPATLEELQLRLDDRVSCRVTRISGIACTILLVDLPRDVASGAAKLVPHPECDPVGQSDGCDGCVGAHMDALRGCSQSHWHRCPNGRLCAVIPLVWDGICVAACRIVCPGTLPESTFQRHIELVEVVVENFVATESDLLRRLMSPPSQEAQVGKPPAITPTEARALADHPRVIEALDYIDRHVTESEMTVRNIAAALDINPTYLAHLFAGQVGVRLSQYISAYRVQRAKRLLAMTNWQIKRVSFKSGHANADWFSQVFRRHTGMSPREYRRRIRLG